jgi:hypothetical protein
MASVTPKNEECSKKIIGALPGIQAAVLKTEDLETGVRIIKKCRLIGMGVIEDVSPDPMIKPLKKEEEE